MLVNDLYYIIPAAIMAFMSSCWIINTLYNLKMKYSLSEREKYSILPGVGIVIAIASTHYFWSSSDYSGFIYLAGAFFIYLLTFYKKGVLGESKLYQLSAGFAAALFLVTGLSSINVTNAVAGTDTVYLGSLNFEIVAASLVIVLISYGFSYLKEIDVLGGGVVIIISSVIGIWFWLAGNTGLAVFSFIISAAFSGYLVSRSDLEGFELDLRSWRAAGLFVGFLFVEFTMLSSNSLMYEMNYLNIMSLLLALSIIPIFAFLARMVSQIYRVREFSIRDIPIVKYLLLLGLSDYQLSLLFWMMNIVLIGVAYSTMSIGGYSQITLLILSSLLLVVSIQLIVTTMLANKFGKLKRERLSKKFEWSRN